MIYDYESIVFLRKIFLSVFSIQAALWFEKVLKAQPDNYETLKILGSLYTQTTDQAKHEVAKEYFRKVTAMQPDDVEAWMELALLLDEQDPRESLRCCNKAVELFREKVNAPMPLEIVNNIGSLYYRFELTMIREVCRWKVSNG